MRIAILESIVMPAGHEVEFDRILVNGLRDQGHEPVMFVPEKFPFKIKYEAETSYLTGGEVVTYAGVGRLKRLWLSIIREKRRLAWFNSAYEKALAGECEAIVIPTATYRYIRTLRKSKLLRSPVPVYIVFHGINPKEKPKFEEQARHIQAYRNVHLKIITLRNDFKQSGLQNIDLIVPPVFKPVDMSYIKKVSVHNPVRLGFFGQFRREKRLDIFLEAFTKANFMTPVELTIQGATAKPEDASLFNTIAQQYRNYKNIRFIHKNLLGREWQEALLYVDALIMPYAAERYRYHWGAMLFTAIGFYKPVLLSPELNPEVLEQYDIGKTIDMATTETIVESLEKFVRTLVENREKYQDAFDKANRIYGHDTFIKNLLRIL